MEGTMSFRTLFAVAFSLACSMSASLSMTGSALAQDELGVDIDRFNPAIQTTDGFMLNSAEDQGHLIFGATLFFDYSRAPLSTGSVDAVSDQVSSRLLLTFGLFDRIIVFGGFKFHLLMETA